MHEMRNSYAVLVRNPEMKVSLRMHKCRWEDNIKSDLQKQAESMWTRLIGSAQGLIAICCEHCTEFSGTIKANIFLMQLSDYQLLMKVPTPQN